MYQRKVNENVNLYIKMITGAQMSEAEADRLSLAIATLADSPAQFEAKLKDSIAVLDRAQKLKQETLEYYSGVKVVWIMRRHWSMPRQQRRGRYPQGELDDRG